MTHAELVRRAKAWLCRQRYQVVVGEVTSIAGEVPDAIGFSPTKHSLLVECKASRLDYWSDTKKLFRRKPDKGMGRLRYFMTPPELVQPDELPDSWGLLWAHPRKVEIKAKASFVEGLSGERQEGILLASLLMRVNLTCEGGLDGVLAEYARRNRELLDKQQERVRAFNDRHRR